MAKPEKKGFFLFNIFTRAIKATWRWIYIILAASMIGFSNAYYDEHRWINDTRNFIQQEQVFNDEDK